VKSAANDPATLEAYGLTRSTFLGPNRMTRQNGWRQDRDKMRRGHFTGMASFTQEDVICSVTGGNGGMRDRQKERLTPADALRSS